MMIDLHYVQLNIITSNVNKNFYLVPLMVLSHQKRTFVLMNTLLDISLTSGNSLMQHMQAAVYTQQPATLFISFIVYRMHPPEYTPASICKFILHSDILD